MPVPATAAELTAIEPLLQAFGGIALRSAFTPGLREPAR